MNKLLFCVLVVSLHFASSATAGDFSTLEEKMTGKEFKETGLIKLTDEELSALNDWLRRHSVATLDNAAAKPPATGSTVESSGDMRGFENRSKDDQPEGDIYSTIDGNFEGWNGKGTLFRLANGMVWQQVEGDTFRMKSVENPKVTIKKGMWGSWYLSVDGYRSDVRVRRVK